MTGNNNNESNHDLQDHIPAERKRTPGWRRVHHSLWFWIFLVLMLGGIAYYIMSGNFAYAPRKQVEQPITSPVAP